MNKLYLEPYFAARAALETLNDQIKALHAQSETSLRELMDKQVVDVSAAIAAGQTTGDPLADELVVAYGPHEPIIRGMTALNEKLVKVKGEEVLIAFTDNEFSVHPGSDRMHWILGVLSGERITVKPAKSTCDVEVVLPFDAFTECIVHSDGSKQVACEKEPFVFTGRWRSTISSNSLRFSMAVGTGESMKDVFGGENTGVFIFVGNDGVDASLSYELGAENRSLALVEIRTLLRDAGH